MIKFLMAYYHAKNSSDTVRIYIERKTTEEHKNSPK